jgi:hypothetical protein
MLIDAHAHLSKYTGDVLERILEEIVERRTFESQRPKGKEQADED